MSRSFLFVPGDVPRMLQNAAVFDADTVIVDLEDSVSITRKEDARHLTDAFLRRHPDATTPHYVRINPLGSDDFKTDVKLVCALPASGVVMPKVTVDALQRLDQLFSAEKCRLDVYGIVESARAFTEIHAIAAHRLIKGLILGAEDLSADLGITPGLGNETLEHAMASLVLAAKAFAKEAVDSPCVSVADDERLQEEITRALRMGFTGKACIHPNHVDAVNRAFLPDEKALLKARRIYEKSRELQSVRFALDGEMIDKPVIERAKALIARAERYRKRGPSA